MRPIVNEARFLAALGRISRQTPITRRALLLQHTALTTTLARLAG